MNLWKRWRLRRISVLLVDVSCNVTVGSTSACAWTLQTTRQVGNVEQPIWAITTLDP